MLFTQDFFNPEIREGFEISAMMKRAWAPRWKYCRWLQISVQETVCSILQTGERYWVL